MKRLIALLGTLTMLVAVPALVSPPAFAGVTKVYAKVLRWSDGDTVVTSKGKVRLIGLDTPEMGRCGSVRARNLALRLAPVGSWVILGNPSTVRDKDAYGRLLRYVNRPQADVALRQIRAGARARYDSRDGYQWHPRQRLYRSHDATYRNYSCTTATSTSYSPTSQNSCPAKAPIKGNRGSNGWIYHMPWNQYYGVTNPEECFATETAAQRAGYRAAKV